MPQHSTHDSRPVVIRFLRAQAAKAAVVAIAVGLYFLASPHHLSARQRHALSQHLRFAATYLAPADDGQPMRTIRQVNPSLHRINAWISSVGAAVALGDIAGTGHPADICLVDPRNNSVSILPAPGTGKRFRPFALPTPSQGYDPATIAPMGCLPIDANEDGRMDILVYYWGRTPVIFLRNDAPTLSAAAFTPHNIVPGHEIWNTNAAIAADVDGDGHPDLIFGNYFADGARVLDTHARTTVHMQHSMSRAYNAGHNRLFLWHDASATSVSYRDASDAFTPAMADGWTLALAARDLDYDLIKSEPGKLSAYRDLPEIYVANDFGPDRLLLNRSTPGHPHFEIVEGRRDLTTPRSKTLGQDSFKGMGVDFGDLTGNGHPAIAVSNISSPYALLESHFLFVYTGDKRAWTDGVAPYRDESFERGTWTSNWAWGIKFVDLLNTGRPALIQAIGFIRGKRNRWPELQQLAMANDELLIHPGAWPKFSKGDDLSGHGHDRIFLPDRHGRFHDVWSELGLDHGTISRGIASGDVYGDGRLSVVIARQWAPSLFLHNVSQGIGRAITVDLRVPGFVAGTRAAIGAEARVRLPNGRIVTSVVDGGSGHSGKRAPEIHLGLGHVAAGQVFDVAFTWRDENGAHSQTIKLKPGEYRIVLGRRTVASVVRLQSRS